MSLTAGQIEALTELEAVWPDAKAVIIGATALGFYYAMQWRQTADVDLIVAVEIEDFPGALISRPGWKQHPRKEHELISPTGAKIDLLPAGPRLLEAGAITWPSGHVMSLAGVDLAFEHAETHLVSADRSALVAPPSVVGVLKMVSYCERPADRERDLEDLAHLLGGYVDDDSDRRFAEALGHEFEAAPAYLFGLDVGRITKAAFHRGLVDRFLDRVLDPDRVEHAMMQSHGPAQWRSGDDLARCLQAFMAGLAGE